MNCNFYYNKGEINGQSFIELGFNSLGSILCDLLARVSPENGSNLFCFKLDDKDVIYYDDQVKLNTYFTGSPILYPIPNRTRDCGYEYGGKKYLQSKNGVPVFMHSLVFDEKWAYKEPVAGKDGISLETFLKVDENHPVYQGFPFKHTLFVVYTLTFNRLTIAYRVVNEDEKELPFGISFHTYFNKLSDDDDCLLSIPAKYRMEVTDDLLPTGVLIETSREPFDLNFPVALSNLDLDDCFTGLDKDRNVEIDYCSLGLKILIDSTDDFTHTHVYTPRGKPFFCVETQTCSADAHNLDAKGFHDAAHLIVVPPGGQFEGKMDMGYDFYDR